LIGCRKSKHFFFANCSHTQADMAMNQVFVVSLVASAFSEMILMEDRTCDGRHNHYPFPRYKWWVKATSTDECSEYCTQSLDCTAWTWDLDPKLNTHTCKMFFTHWNRPVAEHWPADWNATAHAYPLRSPCQLEEKIGSISGRPNVQQCIVNDFCMDGIAYEANVSSYEDCCDVCSADFRCATFSFYPEPWDIIVDGYRSNGSAGCWITHGSSEDSEYCGPALNGLPPQGVNVMSACDLMKDFDGNDEICLGDDLEVDEIVQVLSNTDIHPSWDVCCLRCANTPGCTHWTVNSTRPLDLGPFDDFSASCHLKTGCTETQTRSAAWVMDEWVQEKSGAAKSKLLIA